MTETQTPAADETITVTRTTLEKLEARIEELELAALVSADTPVLPPPTPMGPRWKFLHESAPAFSVLLPPEQRHKTKNGLLEFGAEFTSTNGKRSRYRPRRGKYTTTDPEIAEWLLAEIAAGKFKGVYLDSPEVRLKLQQDEITYLSA